MRVEVWYRDEIGDGRAARLLASLRAAPLPGLAAVRIRDVYLVTGVPGLEPRRFQELVCDRVAQQAAVVPAQQRESGAGPTWDLLLEVAARPGVADPVAGTLRTALHTVLETCSPGVGAGADGAPVPPDHALRDGSTAAPSAGCSIR